MAAVNLRVVRRPKGSSAPHALTAASQIIDNPAKQLSSSITGPGGGRNNWQTEAWDALDLVGELRYYVSWRSSSCSRCRLIVSAIDPVTGLPTGGIENDDPVGQRASEIVKAIAEGPLGQTQFIKRAVECLTVPGEVWIAILYREDSPPGGTWLAVTREEIHSGAGETKIELPKSGENAMHTMDMSVDSLFRVWNPRPRRAREADSPVRATLDSLREIIRTTKTISNASKSRLIGNGVVFVPQEMSLPASAAPVSANKPGDPLPELIGMPAVQQLHELLFQVAQTAYDDEDSMAALIPVFAGVVGDQIKNVSHLRFDNSVTDIAIKTRNDAIARLALGLDVSPERLLGLGSRVNHWSAWLIGDEDVQMHIAPMMQTLVQAINRSVFRDVLTREGIDPAKYMLWYDVSQLTADPDKTTEAEQAFINGTITAEAYRDFLGLGDTGYDFTTLDGWKIWAQDRVSQKPELLLELLPLLDASVQVIDFPQPAIPVAPPPAEAQPSIGQQEPQTENSGGTAPAADQASNAGTRTRDTVELAVVDLLVGRALELAGKRRRTHREHPRLRDIPAHETHRYMPPADDAEVTALIKGWDDSLDEDALSRLNIDPERVRASVRRLAHQQLTRPMIDADGM